METEFRFEFSDHTIHALVNTQHRGKRSIIIHHSKSRSLIDLLLQTGEDGEPQIFVARGRPIQSRSALHRYWPTGWRGLKNIVATIEQSMETDPFFTQAILTLAP